MVISANTALLFTIIFYLSSLVVHVLAIKKILPFQYINGGRSKTYEEQKAVSIKSIPPLFVFQLLVLSGFIFPNFRDMLVYSILMFILTAFFVLGFFMQLLGSKFERYVMSLVLLIGVFSHLQLALIYFS